jgi:hypothetical protein
MIYFITPSSIRVLTSLFVLRPSGSGSCSSTAMWKPQYRPAALIACVIGLALLAYAIHPWRRAPSVHVVSSRPQMTPVSTVDQATTLHLLRNGLRECALPPVGSPALACALLRYRRDIQLPALKEQAKHDAGFAARLETEQWLQPSSDAFFSNHPSASTCPPTLPPAPAPVRWLFFQVLHQSAANGGFADRLIGLMMAVGLALMTDRALGIDFTFPVPLRSALAPGVLPWTDTVPHWIPAEQQLVLSWVNLNKPRLLRETLDAHQNTPIIILRANMNWLPIIAQAFPEKWEVRGAVCLHLSLLRSKHQPLRAVCSCVVQALGLRPGLSLDSYYACFYSLLFVPTPPVRALLRNAELPLEPAHPNPLQLPPSTLSSSLNESTASITSSTAAPAPHVLCAQLRMGGGGLGWKDTHTFINSSTSLEPIWTELERAIAHLLPASAAPPTPPASYVLFVTSDSPDVLEASRKRWGAQRVRTIAGDIVHLDLSFSSAAASEQAAEARNAGFYKVVADNFALGACQFAVISHSGFGRTGVWRTRVPYDAVRVFHNHQIHPLRALPFNTVPPPPLRALALSFLL